MGIPEDCPYRRIPEGLDRDNLAQYAGPGGKVYDYGVGGNPNPNCKIRPFLSDSQNPPCGDKIVDAAAASGNPLPCLNCPVRGCGRSFQRIP
jgi:hypothetical protein